MTIIAILAIMQVLVEFANVVKLVNANVVNNFNIAMLAPVLFLIAFQSAF